LSKDSTWMPGVSLVSINPEINWSNCATSCHHLVHRF
jgi:hypothetical protein